MKRLTTVSWLFAISACFDQFLVGPEPNVAAQFHVSVEVQHEEEVRYLIQANLTPGTDAEGNSRTIVDSTMTVESSTLAGIPHADLSGLTYSWSDSTTQTVRDTIALKGPTLGDQTSATATMLVPLAKRSDPAFRDLVVGQDISLNFSKLGEAPYGFGSDFDFWFLDIRDARTNSLRLLLQGTSPPTPPIVIPAQLLPTVAGDSLIATFTYSSDFASVLAAYPTRLRVYERLSWRMRIVAPAMVR